MSLPLSSGIELLNNYRVRKVLARSILLCVDAHAGSQFDWVQESVEKVPESDRDTRPTALHD